MLITYRSLPKDLWGKCTGQKMHVSFFSATSVSNMLHSNKYLMSYAQDVGT
jgi:hypothetical protein